MTACCAGWSTRGYTVESMQFITTDRNLCPTVCHNVLDRFKVCCKLMEDILSMERIKLLNINVTNSVIKHK